MSKHRKKRAIVEHLAKFITFISICVSSYICYIFQIDSYITTVVVTTTWLYVPDLSAYVIEFIIHIPHKLDSYR